jgi:hypothetical protein
VGQIRISKGATPHCQNQAAERERQARQIEEAQRKQQESAAQYRREQQEREAEARYQETVLRCEAEVRRAADVVIGCGHEGGFAWSV